MLRFIQLTDFLGYELQTEEASEFVNRKNPCMTIQFLVS